MYATIVKQLVKQHGTHTRRPTVSGSSQRTRLDQIGGCC